MNSKGYVEAVGLLLVTLVAIGIGWWGLTQFATATASGLAALGFACFLLTPVAWLGARVHGLVLSGSAGATMMVIAAILGTFHA
jgi:hypothetical protein